jgi:hypothetical protein
MNTPVDMVKLVRDELPARPRGKACIVLTHNYVEQKAWAAELARQSGAEQIDLLDRFAQDNELAAKAGQMLVPNFFEFLKGWRETSVLIVSGMEFLKATWSAQTRATGEFLERIRNWRGDPGLLFAIQYDKTIATHDFGNRFRYQYVVDQRETLAL